jgi:tRNA-specific 2-thiouridylase
MFYTLGQRQGLEVGGVRGASEAPWYVAVKDLERNVLVVVQDHDDPLLMCREFATAPAQWIDGRPPAASFECMVKTRYRQADQPCEVTVSADGACLVRTRDLQRAVTPGQSAVFYDGDACLGGAVIAGSRYNSSVNSGSIASPEVA